MQWCFWKYISFDVNLVKQTRNVNKTNKQTTKDWSFTILIDSLTRVCDDITKAEIGSTRKHHTVAPPPSDNIFVQLFFIKSWNVVYWKAPPPLLWLVCFWCTRALKSKEKILLFLISEFIFIVLFCAHRFLFQVFIDLYICTSWCPESDSSPGDVTGAH